MTSHKRSATRSTFWCAMPLAAGCRLIPTILPAAAAAGVARVLAGHNA